jgi:hypothetical protein
VEVTGSRDPLPTIIDVGLRGGLRGQEITSGTSHVAVGASVHVPVRCRGRRERHGVECVGERMLIPHHTLRGRTGRNGGGCSSREMRRRRRRLGLELWKRRDLPI